MACNLNSQKLDKIQIEKSTSYLDKINQRPLGSSYFCELRLHAKFQLPRWCLSWISMVEEKKKMKISSFRGYLSPAQIELSWVWAGVGLRLTNIHYEYNTTNKQQTGETKKTTNTRGINDTTTKAQQHTKQTGTKPRK